MYKVSKIDGQHIHTDKGVVTLTVPPASPGVVPVGMETWTDMLNRFVEALTKPDPPPSVAPRDDHDDEAIEAWRDGRVAGALSDLPREVAVICALAGVTARVAEDALARLARCGRAVKEDNGRWRLPARIEDEVNRVEKEVEPMLSDRPVQLNVLVSKTGAKLSAVTHALLRLELAGKAYRLPGDRYAKSRPSSEQTVPMTQGESL